MSTKIYNGYKLPYMEYEELLKFLFETKKKFKELVTKEFTSILVNSWAVKCEDAHLNGEPLTKWEAGYDYHLAKQIKEDSNSNTHEIYDFTIHVCLFPYKDCILATFYATHKPFIDFWESLPEVSEYMYWNNSDPLEGCSEDDWDQREDDWENVIGDDTPSDRGFTYDLVNLDRIHWEIPYRENFGEYLNPLINRVGYRAEVTCTDNYLKEVGYSPDAQKGMSEWMRHFREMKTDPSYPEKLDKAKAEWVKKLKDVDYLFTKDD